VHGTSSANDVAPVKLGTRQSTRAQLKLCVVAPQRSGAPKSSTRRSRVAASYERRAGSTWICVCSAIA
jgi:hypothetical protein